MHQFCILQVLQVVFTYSITIITYELSPSSSITYNLPKSNNILLLYFGIYMFSRVIDCSFPTKEELDQIGGKERLNLFRRYFAAMRYNRLLIQQCLIKSAYDESSIPRVEELERLHNLDFINKVKIVKEYGFIDEFVHGVKEEEQALQKIIEAYDKRMNQFFR
jgi:hypothetical protein